MPAQQSQTPKRQERQTSAPRREIELDFIRGVAILMVLDFHAPRSFLLLPFLWLGFPNFGWAGVDIFFVLSGFLVGGLLVKEWRQKSRIDSKRFLIRRGFKIWPQYYFFLLIILITGHRSLHDTWGNLLNIQNYVGGVAHTWTLAVEEHAYLLLLLMLAFAARRQIRMRTLSWFVVGLCLLVAIWRTVLSAHGVGVFERTDTRIDGIFYGLLLAMIYHSQPGWFHRIQNWTGVWLTIVALTLVSFRFQPSTWWGRDISISLADASGVALLLLFYKHNAARQRPVLYRLIAWIGLYSYGIYLWHVSVVEPLVKLSQRLPASLATVLLTAAPLAGIALGVVTTRLIELPALTLRDRWFPRKVESAT